MIYYLKRISCCGRSLLLTSHGGRDRPLSVWRKLLYGWELKKVALGEVMSKTDGHSWGNYQGSCFYYTNRILVLLIILIGILSRANWPNCFWPQTPVRCLCQHFRFDAIFRQPRCIVQSEAAGRCCF